ncbi:MAG: RNA polymerase subunit sigma-24 [Stutzerimonas stutzeri]|nr:MAG: RNA polymerase subunit sigma-24 [Stutzerimonas stutzeri]
MITDLARLGVAWFYTWRPHASAAVPGARRPRRSLRSPPDCLRPSAGAPQAVAPRPERGGQGDGACFVAMVWGEKTARKLARDVRANRRAPLLTFNEPDDKRQANMSVARAIALWPRLMKLGRPLASPAVTTRGTLGPGSWLGRFMTEVDERGYRVDFVAVHYYADSADVVRFRQFLERVHRDYRRPIWVTEWALADWRQPGRFSPAQQAAFAREAAAMLDELDFVERHAWFGIYPGMDGWTIGSAAVAGGRLTEIGHSLLGLSGKHLDEPRRR